MSIETEADRTRTKIQIDINDAIKNIALIVIEGVEGSQDFSAIYIARLRYALNELLLMRDRL